MRKLRITISLLIFIATSQSLQAQYVTLPDAYFRLALQNQYPACINSSQQLDTTCSAIINATALDIQNSTISDLTGINYFKSLQTLYCPVNLLTSLPSLPPTLTYMDCSSNQIANLPALPDSLTYLACGNNKLISLPSLPDTLAYLDCSRNQLTSLPALPNNIGDLYCNNNLLTSLPALPTSLGSLDCEYNQITSLPVLPSSITGLWCYNNKLTSLPTLPASLTTLNCENNSLECLPILPNGLKGLAAKGNNLACIPNLPDSLSSPLATIDSNYQVCNDTNNTNNCPVQQATGITSSIASSTQLLFPNPTTGLVTIQDPQLTGSLVRVINSNGTIVTEQNLSSATLDLSGLPKGLYVVQVTTVQGVFTQKLVLE